MSITDGPALELHVLGQGKGESIVLKLPNGNWAVVDCYARSSTDASTNPTIQFLRSHNVNKLQFVCLTHPHEDHFFGMARLIEEFQPEEFWKVGCLSPEHVKLIAKYYKLRSVEYGVEDFSRTALELLNIFSKVHDGVSRKSMRVIKANSRMTLFPAPMNDSSEFRIECVAPSGNIVEIYEGSIWKCIDADGRIIDKITRTQHNNISLVLKITYGNSVVFLGGDLEKAGWEGVLGEYGKDLLRANAIKVSHHGSSNGYCDNLWESFSSHGKPIAIIAPSHPYRIPKLKTVEFLKTYTKSILSTCRTSIEKNELFSDSRDSSVSVRSRLAVRSVFRSATSPEKGSGVGRCTVKFDKSGITEVLLDEPATTLYAS